MFGKRKHPLLEIRPRRMKIPRFEVYRRAMRDHFMARGVTQIQFATRKIVKDPKSGNTHYVLRESDTDFGDQEGLVKIGDKKVSVHRGLTFLMKYLNINPHGRIGDRNSRVCWNLESDLIEFIGEREHIACCYPDPCYSQEPIRLHSGKISTEHLDPPLPENPIPETQKILDLVREWKLELAEICRKKNPDAQQDSLQRMVDYACPRIPYAWKDPEIDRTLVLWNLHQHQMHSLDRDASYQMTQQMPRDYEMLVMLGIDTEVQRFNDTHPAGDALMYSYRNQYNQTEREFCKIYGTGSSDQAETIVLDILCMDWPMRGPLRFKTLTSTRTRQFYEEIHGAIQDLVDAVFPDRELLKAALRYRHCDHHLFYNFVQEHKHLRSLAIKSPGLLYAAMVAKIDKLGRDKTVETYHCRHGYQHNGYCCNWCLGPMTMPHQMSVFDSYGNPSDYMQTKKLRNHADNPMSTLQDWLDAVYTPKVQQRHPKSKLVALLEKLPVTYHKYLYDGTPPSDIPDFLHRGEEGNLQVGGENLLHTLLYPGNALMESLLSLPVEKFPSGSLGWCVAKYLCIHTRIREKNQASIRDGEPAKGFLLEALRLSGEEADLETVSNKPVLMTGLWKYTVDGLRQCENGSQIMELLNEMNRHVVELHHVLDRFVREGNEILETTKDKGLKRQFEQRTHAFLLEFATYGKKKQQRILERWTRYSQHIPDLEDQRLALGHGKQKIKVCWKPLLQKEIVACGHRVREITDRKDLVLHGKQMNHCIGTYHQKCLTRKGASHILEFIRLETQQPVATSQIVERSTGTVNTVQFLGKYNHTISSKKLQHLNSQAVRVMSDAYSKEWLEEARAHRELVSEALSKENANNLSYGEIKRVQRISTCWKWQLLEKILPGIPKIPADPGQEIPSLPDWIPA